MDRPGRKRLGPIGLWRSSGGFRWVLALLGLPALYVASFGPACRAVGCGWISYDAGSRIYCPVLTIIDEKPSSAASQYLSSWVGLCGGGHVLGTTQALRILERFERNRSPEQDRLFRSGLITQAK